MVQPAGVRLALRLVGSRRRQLSLILAAFVGGAGLAASLSCRDARAQAAAAPPSRKSSVPPAAAPGAPVRPAPSSARVEELPGWPLYDRLCLACHGAAGDGAGPAAPWLWPPPRDLSGGQFKWRSTGLGAPPLRADVRATIEHGVPGAGMPGFLGILDEPKLEQLTDVVLAFAAGAPRPSKAPVPRPTPLGPPPMTIEAARGAQLWQQQGCATCHGAAGRGDGIAAPGLRDAAGRPAAPYDLAVEGGRRPRNRFLPIEERHALARSVATGLSGTPMPGFALPAADLWALADFILELRQRAAASPPSSAPAPRLGALSPLAIAADEQARLTAGYWPGKGEPPATLLFGGGISLQGLPPPSLAPAQASLSALQCARCHAAQFQAWRGSIHAEASSPGLLAQLIRTGKGEMPADEVASCQRCHSPLAEQAEVLAPPGTPFAGPAAPGASPSPSPSAAPPSPMARSATAPPSLPPTASTPSALPGPAPAPLVERWPDNPAFNRELRDQGVTCAACHVRGWHRYGPPRVSPSLLSLPSYPRTELAVYERADFCLPCHQLPPRQALAGRPLLNTYKEWLDGPYFRRGVQCQHCHMPNREHSFLGIHSSETVRQAITLTATTVRHDGAVTVRVHVANSGAGHYLPTTPTPAMWLTIRLLDEQGQPIPGAESRTRIGRHIAYLDGAWRELEDTRIAPGEAMIVAKAWRGTKVPGARVALVELDVSPDEYYERFYEMRLATEKHAEVRAGFERALATARSRRYQLLRRQLAVAPP